MAIEVQREDKDGKVRKGKGKMHPLRSVMIGLYKYEPCRNLLPVKSGH